MMHKDDMFLTGHFFLWKTLSLLDLSHFYLTVMLFDLFSSSLYPTYAV